MDACCELSSTFVLCCVLDDLFHMLRVMFNTDVPPSSPMQSRQQECVYQVICLKEFSALTAG